MKLGVFTVLFQKLGFELFRPGIHLPDAIRALGEATFPVHAKDTLAGRRNTALNGCLDFKPYALMAARSWNFRTVGWGHGLECRREIVSALRLAGYDFVLSIEHEDGPASAGEGLGHSVSFLRQCLLAEPPPEVWWT